MGASDPSGWSSGRGTRQRLTGSIEMRGNGNGSRLSLKISAAHSPALQPFGEMHDGLAVDHRPVPLAHDLEIGGALAIERARLPAAGLEQIGSGGEHVGHAVAQVDMAVAVVVDAVLDVGGRQKLGLADL